MPQTSPPPPIGSVDIGLLRLFKVVAECGGLAAAESELGIGRSTISKRLSELETWLGLRLCSRGPGGFYLTAEGAQVVQATEALLAQLRAFDTRVSEVRQTLGGTLRIAGFDQSLTHPDARLAPALGRFTARAPDVDLDLSALPPHAIEARLLDGTLDIGFLANHRPLPGIDYQPVYGEDLFLYCGRGHALFDAPDRASPAELRQARGVMLRVNAPDLQAAQAQNLTPRAEVDSVALLATLVLSGQYIGFLPAHLAARHEADDHMRRLCADTLHHRVSYVAATCRVPGPNRITRLFLDILCEHLGQ